MTSAPGSGYAAAVGLLLALAGPSWLAAASRRLAGTQPSWTAQVVGQLLLCGIAVAVLAILVSWHRVPLRTIGIRQPDLFTPVLAVIIVGVARWLLPLLAAPLMRWLDAGGFEAGIGTLAAQPAWWRVIIALTSGPVEEILYRGYAVEQLAALTGSRPLGGALAALAFGLAHVPFWGLGPALAADLPFGVLMVGAYLWRQDLVANSAAHTILLLVSLLEL